MSAEAILQPAHWQRNFSVTDADQPVAPILGILSTLRANQWIVLLRLAGESVTAYFPYRKRELALRLSNVDPTSLASHALRLPEQGAKSVRKAVWKLPSPDPEFPEFHRPVLLDEAGHIRAIGIAYEAEKSRMVTVRHECSSQDDFEPQIFLEQPIRADPAGPESKAGTGDDEEHTRENLIVPIFYATDREPQNIVDCNTTYSGIRSKDGGINLGMCSISIPNIHRIGYLERPPWWKIWARPQPQKHVMLLSTIQLEASRFWSELNGHIDASARKDAFVFVHGYNVSFETGALRTAQLATDLGFKGAPIMFSWPSKGKLREYLSDEGAIQWSRPHLLQFLSDLCENGNVQSLHLIAHSMGNRALLEVLQALNSPDISQGLLKQLILAAPDVDAGVFGQLVGLLSAKCERVTLYASSNDKALKASKAIHNYARAGEAGSRLMILNGIDTVDASSVDTDFLGHSVFAEQRALLQDIFYLLEHGLDPTMRFGLKQFQTGIGPYWSFSA